MKNFTHAFFTTKSKSSFRYYVATLGLLLVFFTGNNSFAQVSWSGATSVTYLTATNWTGGVTPSGASTEALFNNNTNAGANALNMNSITVGQRSIGAWHFGASATTVRTLSNSSGTAGGTFTLNGLTINSVANTIIRNASSATHVIAPGASTGMILGLGNATNNVIAIDGNGGLTISSVISGANNLTKAGVGSGVLTLSGVNTYSGNTTISTGTLALSTAGSIASSPIITVASGAGFNISGRTAALALAAAQSLRSSATGSNTTATVTVAATPTLTLSAGGLAFTAYGGGATAPMTVAGTGGSLALNSSPVTVTTTTALTAGTYKLIAASGSATVTGTPGTLTVGGSGLASSTTGALSIVSGELILTVTSSGPTITLAQLSTGIAPSPLVASTTDKAILGFSATSSTGTPSMTAFNIGTSSTSVSKFTNVKLYTSTDNNYATAGDNTQITGFTFAQTATELQFSALTEALSTSAKNYFIVADIDASVTGATTAVQPSLTNANVTVASATITGGTLTGTNYSFAIPSGTPTISPSGTLAAVNTIYGTASASPTSFTVSGSDLTDDIVITPPAGFEISKTAIGSGYASTQTLTQSAGTVALTTIYVRLANTNAFGTYSGNITLVSSLDAISLNVATASSTVVKKALTISGLSLIAASKVYDATTTAAITGTAALQATTTLALNTSGDGKPIDTDTVSLTGSATGAYNTKDVATATTVSYSGLSLTGASAANYSLTDHATSAATITAKPITLSGLTVPASKVYNGTTAAVVTGTPGTLATAIAPGSGTAVDGIRYTGDTATLTGIAVGTYNNADVASATTVVFTGVSLTGAQAGNYSLTAHPSQAATITKATAVITFGALAAKTTTDVPFALTATSTSGNTVTYVSGTPATATIAGSTVTIVAAGTTLITASDAGNANYNAAVDVSQTLTVNSPPCLTQGNFTATPSGWVQTSITYVTNEANFASNNGELTTIAVSNPNSLTFNLRRSGNATAKTLFVEVSTTTQGGTYTTVATYDHANTTSGGTITATVDLSAYTAFSSVYIKFRKASSTASPWYMQNVNVYCTDPATISTLATYASQPSSTIITGSNNVTLAGFSVTPGASADFTSVTLTGTSTVPADISNVRIFRDNNGNGIIDGLDASVSGAGIAFANGNLAAITITGETGFSTVRNYIIVSNISATATSTSVGVAIGSGNFTTSLATKFGSMAINTRAIAGPTITLAQLSSGIAPSPLVASTTDKSILGFSVTSSAGTPSMTAFNIGTSSTSVSKFTNIKLYTSTDNNYATAGDNTQITGFTFAQTATQLQFSALTETLSTSAKNYFIVADIDATVTAGTTAVQPSLTNANVAVATATITGGTIIGTNYAFAIPSGTPTILPSGTLAAVNAIYGTVSASPTSFTVSASDLTDDIVITPPAGFEVSKTVGGASGYASSQTLTQSGGTVALTTIYVRLANTNAFGTYSGNITLVSTLDAISLDVATASSTVAKKALTVTGLSLVATSKVYDATTTAAITGAAALQAATPLALNTSVDGKPITGDTVSLSFSIPTGTYNTKDVATATTVSYAGYTLTGASAANYTLDLGTAAATITPKPLTFSGLTVPASKVYNGTTTAVVTDAKTLQAASAPEVGTAVDGQPYTGDIVGLTGTATGSYNDANVASATTVTFGGVTLNGAQAGNYSLTTHAAQAATITKATAVITFGALAAKTTADVPFALTATSTSGNTPTYVSGTPATATIAGSTVTLGATGTTLITASDAGNANYNAAVDVSQTLTVSAVPIWSNTLTGTSLSSANPYTTGNTVVPNLTVAGIGVTGANPTGNTNDRYNTNTWSTGAIDTGKYFYFTMTPDPGYEINFTNLVYISQVSSGTPSVSIRSSVDSYASDIATPAVAGGAVSLSAFQNITSAITFRIYVYNIAGTGTTFSINDFRFNGEVVLGTPSPEINVTQGGSIASGGTNAFGNQENGTSGSAVTFTIQNTGNSVLNLTGSPKVAITGNTADFVINELATTATVAATSGTTTFTVTFSPQAVGARAAQLSIANDDSNENPYLINLTGTGTTSQQSTISAATFTAPTNIAYGSFQANDITAVNSVEAGRFTIQDGASDNDNFGTILSTLTLGLSNSANIKRVALYDGSTELQEITAGATNVFNAPALAANLFTTDGGSKTFSVRVTFNATVTDNQQFQFTATAATADAAGSGFATVGGTTSVAGNDNKIVVTASRFTFGTVIGSSVNLTLPSFTITATDILGNTDLDRIAAVTLGTTSVFSSANFTRTTPTYALTGGSITISNVAFADAQTGINLTADAPGLTQGVSNTIDILLVTFPANSYRSIGAGDWATTATWQRFVSGVWGASAAPSTNTTNTVYIRHAISSNGSISTSTIVIESGGTLTYTASSTCATSMLVENGGTLQINAALDFTSATVTVESGGAFNVNYATATGATTLWAGTEDFQAGSTVDIQNWSYGSGTGFRLIQNPSSISANTDGYYFGNLTISGAPSSLFVVADGSQTINLCRNNFKVSESGTNNVAITNAGTNATIGGNIIVTTGQLSIAGSTNGNPVTTVLGNISVASGGILNLNQQNSASATSIVQLKGNLSVVSGGTLNCSDVGGSGIVFSGTTATQTVSFAGTLGTNADFEVGDGTNATTVQLIDQDLSLTNASNAFTVKANGILDFNNLNISGAGDFTLDGTGELRITAAAGLNASGTNTGNVINTGTRSIAQTGYFRYTGNVTPQATGNAWTTSSNAKRIIIEKTNPTDVVNLTQSTGTTNSFEIIEGTFVETAAANITGSGNLVMSGGTYRTAVLTTTLPQLSGTYTLTGGTIDLNGAGGQVLRGARAYSNLSFSTSGTKTLTSAISSITGTVTVQNSVILDVANRTFGGPGTNLTMTGTSRYITQGTGTKPDAEGTYSLGSGTTIEFANSAATTQVIYLGSTPISYANVEVTGTSVSSNSITDGILFQAGGSFTVKQGASFTLSQPGGLNGLVNSAVSSTNSPTVTLENTPSLSTIVYNSTVAQSLTGRLDYGNLTINTIGGGLTTSGDVTVSGTLTLTSGIITTGANTIAVTNDTTPISGGSATAYVNGKLRLTYPAIGTDVARTFPIGKGGVYRPLVFSYDTAPASRTVLVEQFEAAFPSALPSSAAQFGNRYWNVTQSSTGASYKVTLNTTTPTSSTVVMIRREGAGASTSNEVASPNYTNLSSFATTNVSNDLALGTCIFCTQIRPIQCGKTLSYLTSAIQASPRVGATEYTFEVTRVDNSVVNTIVTSNYYFFPATLITNGLVYGKSYSIRVRVRVGGVLQAFGNTCIVTAPNEPAQNTITKIRPIQCGKTLNYITDAIQASPVYKAVRYEFEVYNGDQTAVIPTKNYYFRLSQFPGGGVLNTAYTIRVRSSNAPAPAAFTDWGDYCVVSTPIARLSEEANDVFEVKSFPNPFASHFNLDIESSSDALVQVKVYDMIGRQLEVRKASVSELSVLEIGRNYPSGVYNLVVSQGDKVKSLRMIKR